MTRSSFRLWHLGLKQGISEQHLAFLEAEVIDEAKKEWGPDTNISFDRDQALAVVAHHEREIVILREVISEAV